MELGKIVKLGIGLVLIAGLLYVADISAAVNQLSKLNPWFYIAATAVFMTGVLIGGLRWFLFNQLIDEDIGVKNGVKTYLVNYSLSTVFIGNLAEAGRFKIQERYTEVKSSYALTGAVVVEKIFDFVSVSSVILFSAPFTFSSISKLLIFPGIGGLKSSFMETMDEGSIVLRKLQEDRSSAFRIGLMSLSIWWLEAVAFYLIVVGLGADVGFFQAAITTSVISLASALPVTPGGLGTAESAGYAALALFGVSSGSALALIVGQRFLETLLSSVPGAVIYARDYMF